MARILIPLPALDFDPTETAVPWRILSAAGHEVFFATPEGEIAHADQLMLDGIGLDPWGWLPTLKQWPLVGRLLRANADARADYAQMIQSCAFQNPLRWSQIQADDFDALLLPGGHRARGMRRYLESEPLQALVAAFFATQKPLAAICHGVLLAARSKRADGRSVLYGYRSTALTWKLEKSAWQLARITRFWDPYYYRTYREQSGEPSGYMSVQQEVSRALAKQDDFCDVPRDASDYRRKTSGLVRDSDADPSPAFVLRDRHYLSARWPGDAHAFAQAFATMLAEAG